MESIEVERKFAADASCTARMAALGASLVTRRTFTDTYFDNGSHELTLADYWLRQRDGAWQLKFPPARRTAEHAGLAATRQYAELSDPDAILGKLRAAFGGGGEASNSLEDWLSSRGCVGFATFATERTVYSLDGVTVDLDTADFGYAVGEVELTVGSVEDVPAAVQRVEALCSRIATAATASQTSGGASPPPPGGKLEAYMLAHCRDHWDELVQAGLLGSDSEPDAVGSAPRDESERRVSPADA